MIDFAFHTPQNTAGATHELLAGIQKRYGFFPNIFGYMAEAPAAVEAYLALNELVSKTSLTPAQQQVALLAVSVENDCDYCAVAHRATGKTKNAKAQTMAALGSRDAIDDANDRALAAFAQSVTRSRGRPTNAELQAFLDAGFTRQQIFEVILIVCIKTLSNYSNHLTHPEPDPQLVAML